MSHPHLEFIRTIRQTARNFWAAWLPQEARLAELDRHRFVEEGNRLLAEFCDEGIALECEGDPAENAAIVFSANGIRPLFPQVQALAEAAADTDTRYDVRAFRQPVGPHPDFSIGMDGFSLAAADIMVALGEWRQHPALDIGFARHIPDELFEHACNMAFIIMDHILGEWNTAVKIGAVDFRREPPADAFPLTDLPEKLDTLWRTLGHSGLYPEPEWQYAMYEAHNSDADESGDNPVPVLFTQNQSAASLLGRADMAWFVCISCSLTNAGSGNALDDVYALQDAFKAEALLNQQGIDTLTVTDMAQGSRLMYCATSEPQRLLEKAQALCARHPQLQAEAVCEYDPAWEHYRL